MTRVKQIIKDMPKLARKFIETRKDGKTTQIEVVPDDEEHRVEVKVVYSETPPSPRPGYRFTAPLRDWNGVEKWPK